MCVCYIVQTTFNTINLHFNSDLILSRSMESLIDRIDTYIHLNYKISYVKNGIYVKISKFLKS